MNPSKNNKADVFIDFLSEDIGESERELTEELEGYNINVLEMGRRVNNIINCARNNYEPEWLVDAKKTMTAFNEMFQNSEDLESNDCTLEDLICSINAGDYGDNVRGQAQLFFRNRRPENIDGEEIRSFLKDCKLLDEVKKKNI